MARIVIKPSMKGCRKWAGGLSVAALSAVALLSGCVAIPDQAQLVHNGNIIQNCMAPVASSNSPVGLDAEAFSLTTWNIYKGKLQGWDRDLQILGEHSDVLLIQEAHLGPELERWLKKEELDWVMAQAFNLRGSWSGVLTGSRAAQQNPCMQRTSEPYLRLPKTALISYFPIQGQAESLLVVNVHGVNFTFGSADLDSQFQAVQKVLDNHPGPVVVAGDFNTWSNARMAVIRRLAEQNGLSAVEFQGEPAIRFGHRIDHVYYRGLAPLQSRVTEVESSDHHPLTVTFKLD